MSSSSSTSKFTNLINEFAVSRQNLDCVQDSERNRFESFNILDHDIIPLPQCVKEVTKGLTTYRNHFCGGKRMPESTKICLPYPGIHVSEEQMRGISTYKDDFHLYNLKDQQINRGKAAAQKCNLTCAKDSFGGKSETKFAFNCPESVQSNSMKLRTLSSEGTIKKWGREKQRFAATTTYSSEFKKPKFIQRTNIYRPTLHVLVSTQPFKNTSQYMNDFKIKKKDIPSPRMKTHTFTRPSVPMASNTTYKESFTFKVPPVRKIRPPPDYRCKECKTVYRNNKEFEDKLSYFGDCDKSRFPGIPAHFASCRKEATESITHENMEPGKIFCCKLNQLCDKFGEPRAAVGEGSSHSSRSS